MTPSEMICFFFLFGLKPRGKGKAIVTIRFAAVYFFFFLEQPPRVFSVPYHDLLRGGFLVTGNDVTVGNIFGPGVLCSIGRALVWEGFKKGGWEGKEGRDDDSC